MRLGPSPRPLPIRAWGAVLLLLWGLLQALPPAHAASSLVLIDGSTNRVPLWPSLTMLSDASKALRLPDVLQRRNEFAPPTTSLNNLGQRTDSVWLHTTIQLDASVGARWLVSIDYAALDNVELYLIDDTGRVVQHEQLGDTQPTAQRPLQVRPIAAALDLKAGRTHELFLRITSSSAFIVPLELVESDTLHANEAVFHMVQGGCASLGMLLGIYTLLGALRTREPLYLWFSITAVASTLFFAAYYGFGQMYLWPHHPWMVQNASALLVLVLLFSGFLFVERSLGVGDMSPRAGQALRVGAAAALLGIVLHVSGLIDYRGATAWAGVLGMLPMFLSMPVAYRRAKTGDSIAAWTFLGWGAYTFGVVVMAGITRGGWAVTTFSLYAYQVAALVQFVVWAIILSERVAAIQRQAEQAQRERDQVLQIAQTDPLTGLLNRRGLQQAMAPLVEGSRDRMMTAVYLLDLDGFKPVNDTHGHDAGDELLIQVGQRLRQAVRATDLVARMGGDEFVVVASQLRGELEADQVGHKLLACCDSPFELTHISCHIGVTIGYAIAPIDGTSPEQLIKQADVGMYAGKQAGKRCVRRVPSGRSNGTTEMTRTAMA